MSKLKKHGYADWLKYMHMPEEGYSCNYIHSKLGINNKLLLRVWKSYQQYRARGFEKQA